MSETAPQSLMNFPARYFAGWNDKNLEKVDDLFASTLSWTDPSLPAEVTDLAGAHNFFTTSWAAFPDIHFEQTGEVLVDAENQRIAAEWRMTGTHSGGEFPPGVPASGQAFDVYGTDVFTVDEQGRATVIRAYYDAATLARQLGLV
jgi:steroid delta-isomerase-like uncharacterized protein